MSSASVIKECGNFLIRVLENLKDYALRAVVNTVDHLGNVAYKLNELFEQQSLNVSTSEVKISCLNQVTFSRTVI